MHIVVVCSHPDEEVLRFGGTIATHVRQGHKATIVVMTRGVGTQFDAGGATQAAKHG